MAYKPIKSLEDAYGRIKDEKKHMGLLADVRDEFFGGEWNPMIESLMRQKDASPNSSLKWVIVRDLEYISRMAESPHSRDMCRGSQATE